MLAAWALAEAIARPTRLTQGLLVVAVLAVCATRVQAIGSFWSLSRQPSSTGGLRGRGRAWETVAGGGGARRARGYLARVPARLGLATLGGYEVITTTSWSVGGAPNHVVYHPASLLILCGLFPAAALALLFVRAVRSGEEDPRVRAFLAVASSLTVWLVFEVGSSLPLLGPDRRVEPDRARAGAFPRTRAVD